MSPKGVKRTQLVFIEKYEPDPKRVEQGLAILARMIARAMVRDARNGHVPSPEEEAAAAPEVPQSQASKRRYS